ncbi:MAG: hypothetical protein ACYCPW_04335 [Nitrososphaerales archaeon]
MSESLSEEQLAELMRSGRVNTSRSSAKRFQTKTSSSINLKSTRAQTSAPRAIDSPREVELTTSKEVDAEWLRAEKEKAERNIATERKDKRRREEMREASRF